MCSTGCYMRANHLVRYVRFSWMRKKGRTKWTKAVKVYKYKWHHLPYRSLHMALYMQASIPYLESVDYVHSSRRSFWKCRSCPKRENASVMRLHNKEAHKLTCQTAMYMPPLFLHHHCYCGQLVSIVAFIILLLNHLSRLYMCLPLYTSFDSYMAPTLSGVEKIKSIQVPSFLTLAEKMNGLKGTGRM
jgi:hypothetical protein